MSDGAALYRGRCLNVKMITHAVRRYFRFALGFHNIEELFAERGILTSCETVQHCVAKLGAHYAEEIRRRAARPARTWHSDEMATLIGGTLHRLWRAADEQGHTLDVLLQA